jgi:hypothetical protein
MIRRAFRELEIEYVFINPSAEIARLEDLVDFREKYRYFALAEEESFIFDAINWISRDIKKRRLRSATIFIPWLPQFTEVQLRSLLSLQDVIELAIFGVTMRSVESLKSPKKIPRFQFQELFESEEAFKILWIDDETPEALTSIGFMREWPQYAESLQIKKKENSLTLGFFGMLSAERGMGEVLILALFNPKLQVVIRGYSYRKFFSWKPARYSYLRYTNWREKKFLSLFFGFVSLLISQLRYLPNVSFSNTPFSTEEELSGAISDSSAVFYCAKLSHGSGISMKSLASGVPVLWNGKEGNAVRLLRKSFPQGYFRVIDLFVLNRMASRVLSFEDFKPTSPYDWSGFVEELSVMKNF